MQKPNPLTRTYYHLSFEFSCSFKPQPSRLDPHALLQPEVLTMYIHSKKKRKIRSKKTELKEGKRGRGVELKWHGILSSKEKRENPILTIKSETT